VPHLGLRLNHVKRWIVSCLQNPYFLNLDWGEEDCSPAAPPWLRTCSGIWFRFPAGTIIFLLFIALRVGLVPTCLPMQSASLQPSPDADPRTPFGAEVSAEGTTSQS